MADERHPPHVGFDDATARDVESREETIEHAVQESGAVQHVDPTVETVDPTQRRGLNRALRRRILELAIAGFVGGAVLGVILGVLPGPAELAGQGDAPGSRAAEWTLFCIVLGIAIAIVTAVIGGLVLLQREDGRVQRDVERRVPPGEERPDVSAPPDDPSRARRP
jgi:hypothetical protein